MGDHAMKNHFRVPLHTLGDKDFGEGDLDEFRYLTPSETQSESSSPLGGTGDTP